MFGSRPSAFELLVDANPVPLARAHALAVDMRLDEFVLQQFAWIPTPVGSLDLDPERSSSTRVRRLALALTLAAAIVAVVAASPALGFLKDSILPFFGLESAPRTMQLQFSSLSLGAPAGMDPQAIGDQTRKVETASLSGTDHTLWVAPTEAGGFCYLWTPGYGGCDAEGTVALDAIGPALVPSGVSIPTVPPNASDAQKAAAVQAGHALATITPWLVGFVAKDAHSVRVTFSDGSTAQPPITWVSAPISAGFYTYQASGDKQTQDDHIVSVEALTADGAVITKQVLHAH
jgi:hypothetical protein